MFLEKEIHAVLQRWSREGLTAHLVHREGRRRKDVAGDLAVEPEFMMDARTFRLTGGWELVVMGWDALTRDRAVEVERTVAALSWMERDWDREELVAALTAPTEPEGLADAADRLRRQVCGEEVHRRGLIEFSNYCRRNCAYCGLRRDNSLARRYRMSEEEVLESARQAKRLGYHTVVLQSGEDPGISNTELCRWVERIKIENDVAVTLSVGERSYQDYRDLREAGADRYLMRFETSDEDLFVRMKPDAPPLRQRLERLAWLRQLGYEVGSGCLVGLPGQTTATLADDLILLKKLDLEMVGIGPFIPHPHTPLRDAAGGTLELSLRFLSLVRLVTGSTHIPATTAMGSIDPLGRQKALRRGADVIMPNVTPTQYRADYEIYPGKICLTEKPADCSGCTGGMIRALGRTIGRGYGGSIKKQAAGAPSI